MRGRLRSVRGVNGCARRLARLRSHKPGCTLHRPSASHRYSRSIVLMPTSPPRPLRFLSLCAGTLCLASAVAVAQSIERPPLPALHHVGLNSLDPERAIDWYLRLWPSARRTVADGRPAVKGEMLLIFHSVATPPTGAWRHDLHRAEPQSAFWHIGAFTNTTSLKARLDSLGHPFLPLFTSPSDTGGIWRSGLAPYVGTLTEAQLATAAPAAPRDGGFGYVVAPDGALFELTGGPATRESLSHVHFYHEAPLCAANWYVEHLGFELPPVRGTDGRETPRTPWAPCEAPLGEAGWPSLERIGTLRQPAGSVRYSGGTMSWYPRQCVGARCGGDTPLVPSRGQVLDHVAFTIADFETRVEKLRRAGVRFLAGPYKFGDGRAVMIEDPDGLSIELVEGK